LSSILIFRQLHHEYDAIVQATQSYTTINHKKCTQCRGKVELKVNYHSHLLIECSGDTNVKIALKTFPKRITLHNASFSLVGVIHYFLKEGIKKCQVYALKEDLQKRTLAQNINIFLLI